MRIEFELTAEERRLLRFSWGGRPFADSHLGSAIAGYVSVISSCLAAPGFHPLAHRARQPVQADGGTMIVVSDIVLTEPQWVALSGLASQVGVASDDIEGVIRWLVADVLTVIAAR